DRLPRMADFCLWVMACEATLGWPTGSFAETFMGQVADTNDLVLDASLVVAPLRKFMTGKGEWEGTANELFDHLKELVTEAVKNQRGWPKLPHVLTRKLKRLAPNLRRAGIDVQFNRETDQSRNGRPPSIPLRRTLRTLRRTLRGRLRRTLLSLCF